MFDPVAAVLALKADELKALLSENPWLLVGLREHQVLAARWRVALERADQALEDYRAGCDADLTRCEAAAFRKYRRAEQTQRRLYAELSAAFQAERRAFEGGGE